MESTKISHGEIEELNATELKAKLKSGGDCVASPGAERRCLWPGLV
jgi:hypothetical protein